MLSLLAEVGEHFSRQGKIMEIAIYGGSAIILQFDFRQTSLDIDYIPVSVDDGSLEKIAEQVSKNTGCKKTGSMIMFC